MHDVQDTSGDSESNVERRGISPTPKVQSSQEKASHYRKSVTNVEFLTSGCLRDRYSRVTYLTHLKLLLCLFPSPGPVERRCRRDVTDWDTRDPPTFQRRDSRRTTTSLCRTRPRRAVNTPTPPISGVGEFCGLFCSSLPPPNPPTLPLLTGKGANVPVRDTGTHSTGCRTHRRGPLHEKRP